MIKTWGLDRVIAYQYSGPRPSLYEQLNYTGSVYYPKKYPEVALQPTKGRMIFDIEGLLEFQPSEKELTKLAKVVSDTCMG